MPKKVIKRKRKIHTGKRGGKYYISKGRKVYVKSAKRPVAKKRVKKVKTVKPRAKKAPTVADFKAEIKAMREEIKAQTDAEMKAENKAMREAKAAPGPLTVTTFYEGGKSVKRTFKPSVWTKDIPAPAIVVLMRKGSMDNDTWDFFVDFHAKKFPRPDPEKVKIEYGGKSKTVSF